jgi:hypothetical protein
MMRQPPRFRKRPRLHRAIDAGIEMLGFEGSTTPGGSGPMRSAHHLLIRLLLAIPVFLTLALQASAGTMTETASKWGLIGPWSLDCSLPPDRGRGTVLSYVIVRGDRLMHRRNFGDDKDENEVVGAEVSADGVLNLRVFFASMKQTREYGLMKQPDGTMRAMYNRDQKGEYTIRDGKFTANGNPTPSQHKCN